MTWISSSGNCDRYDIELIEEGVEVSPGLLRKSVQQINLNIKKASLKALTPRGSLILILAGSKATRDPSMEYTVSSIENGKLFWGKEEGDRSSPERRSSELNPDYYLTRTPSRLSSNNGVH